MDWYFQASVGGYGTKSATVLYGFTWILVCLWVCVANPGGRIVMDFNPVVPWSSLKTTVAGFTVAVASARPWLRRRLISEMDAGRAPVIEASNDCTSASVASGSVSFRI